ncbi:MAG: dienelactone hydrolase family protein [Elusimicrobia bacterium]|nr:dienelactone hydrolase family protein [Elusimicrobiota bacterium]
MKRLTIPAALLLLASVAGAAVKTESIDYKDGDVVLEGYAAWDDAAPGKRPGVLIIHDWLGPGEHTRKTAEDLAALGYAAFALDIYGKDVHPKNHEEARKLSGLYGGDRGLLRRRASVGLAELKKLPVADPSRLAAIGYCFGGGAALELARMGADLRGVATFHGTLKTSMPATSKPLAKILVMHGADDKFVNAQVADFQEEMKKVGADWEFDTYSGTVHGFSIERSGSDASTNIAYNAQSAQRSWKRFQEFMKEIFAN